MGGGVATRDAEYRLWGQLHTGEKTSQLAVMLSRQPELVTSEGRQLWEMTQCRFGPVTSWLKEVEEKRDARSSGCSEDRLMAGLVMGMVKSPE